MANAKKLPSGSWRCLVFSHTDGEVKHGGEQPSPLLRRQRGDQRPGVEIQHETLFFLCHGIPPHFYSPYPGKVARFDTN